MEEEGKRPWRFVEDLLDSLLPFDIDHDPSEGSNLLLRAKLSCRSSASSGTVLDADAAAAARSTLSHPSGSTPVRKREAKDPATTKGSRGYSKVSLEERAIPSKLPTRRDEFEDEELRSEGRRRDGVESEGTVESRPSRVLDWVRVLQGSCSSEKEDLASRDRRKGSRGIAGETTDSVAADGKEEGSSWS